MDIWLTKEFARLARKNRVTDKDLRTAVRRAENGSVDAQIGRFLIKQRVARAGEGRSGGLRTIICVKVGERAVFLHLFEKSRTANLTPIEEEVYREFAGLLAGLAREAFEKLARKRGWRMISNDEPEEDVPK